MQATAPRSLSPQVLLVKWDLQDGDTAMCAPDEETGVVYLQVAYINHFSKFVERRMQMRLRSPMTLHLARSEYSGWHYAQQWDTSKQRYYCTCYPFRRSGDQATCSHCEYLEQLDSLVA